MLKHGDGDMKFSIKEKDTPLKMENDQKLVR